MEDLALLLGGIFLGLLVLGAFGVVLAILARKNKISKYWALGFVVLLTVVAIIAWQGSERLAAVPLAWAVLASVIALWPLVKAKYFVVRGFGLQGQLTKSSRKLLRKAKALYPLASQVVCLAPGDSLSLIDARARARASCQQLKKLMPAVKVSVKTQRVNSEQARERSVKLRFRR